jgi:hypothetical protein
MKCTCGASTVGGGHSSWCDTTIEIPQLELARQDDDGQNYFFNYSGALIPLPPNNPFAPQPSPPQAHPAPSPAYYKQYNLRLHNVNNPAKYVEEELLTDMAQIPFMETEIDAWKKKFPFSSCLVNGKEHVNFITLTFEEV